MKANPAETQLQMDFALSYENLGNVQKEQKNMPAALASFQAAIDAFDSLAKADPSNAEWQRALSVAYHYMGSAQWSAGELPAALTSFRADLAIIGALVKAAPANPSYKRDLAVAYNWTGSAQRAHGDLDDALASFQAGLAISKDLVKANQANDQWQTDFAILSRQVGHTLFWLGRMPDAAAAFTEAIETGRSADPAELYFLRGLTRIQLADAPGAVGDLAAALKSVPSNAYYVLWLHAARVLAGQDDINEFQANAKAVDRGPWPGAIVDLYLGTVTPAAALKLAAAPQDETTRTARTCEANFFVGIYDAGKSGSAAARPLFQAAVDQCPHDHFQYLVSRYEIAQIDRFAKAH
jgi:lipoprotein NlpI